MSERAFASLTKYNFDSVPAAVCRLPALFVQVNNARQTPVNAEVVRARQPFTGCIPPSYHLTRFASFQRPAFCKSVPFLCTPGGIVRGTNGIVDTLQCGSFRIVLRLDHQLVVPTLNLKNVLQPSRRIDPPLRQWHS